MITLWRLSNDADLSGRSWGGRWVAAGDRVIVLDPTPLAALCARLALAEVSYPEHLPRGYRLMRVRAPSSIAECPPGKGPATAAFVDDWYAEDRTLLLALNCGMGRLQYLLNGDHPRVAECELHLYDAATTQDLLFEAGAAHLLQGSAWLARPERLAS